MMDSDIQGAALKSVLHTHNDVGLSPSYVPEDMFYLIVWLPLFSRFEPGPQILLCGGE